MHRSLFAVVAVTSILAATGCGDDTTEEDSTQNDGSNVSGADFGDIGKNCTYSEDCQYNTCLYKTGADVGYCSNVCTETQSCPNGFVCGEVSNASALYCVIPRDSIDECQDACDEYDFFPGCMATSIDVCRNACVTSSEPTRENFIACVENDLECTSQCDTILGG